MPSGPHSKPLYSAIVIGTLLLTFVGLAFVPISSKSGIAKGTEGSCVGWGDSTTRYSYIRNQKQDFKAVELTERQVKTDDPMNGLCAGKFETHTLYIL